MSLLTPLALQNADLLRALDAGGFGTLADLARKLERKPFNLARSLKSLDEAGLVDFDEASPLPTPVLKAAGREVLAALARAEGGGETPAAAPAIEGVAQLLHVQICPDPLNPRKHFDEEAIAELAESIAQDGLLENLVVRAGETEFGGVMSTTISLHRLVAGERRFRAIGKLIQDGRWPKDRPILCKVVDIDDAGHRRLALVENLQRKDLRPIDEAEALRALMEVTGQGTAEIAQEIGFTQRFVQQRLQLLQLNQTQRDAVNSGEMSIEEARRIAAAPKPAPLSPEDELALSEALHALKHFPRKQYYGSTEVSFRAVEDPAFERLCKANMLRFSERDWQTQRAYVDRGYRAHQHAVELLPLLDEDKACAALHDRRLAVLSADAVAEIEAAGRYATSWLNGPFDLSPLAQRELERLKVTKAEDRDRNKKAKEARRRRLAAIEALDQDLKQSIYVPIDDRIPAMLRKAKIALPLQLKNGRLHDAKGQPVADSNWRFGDEGEAVNLLLATIVNAAAGYPTDAIESAPSEPEDGDSEATSAPDVQFLDDDDADEDLPEFLTRLTGPSAAGANP